MTTFNVQKAKEANAIKIHLAYKITSMHTKLASNKFGRELENENIAFFAISFQAQPIQFQKAICGQMESFAFA